MLLIYYRTYITHAFLAFLFSIGDATVSRNIRRLEPLLAGIFRIPERRAEVREDEVRELFFDGTERPTRRPQRRQRRSYSGKEERHTLKNQVVVVRKRKRAGGRPGGGRSAGSGWRRCRRWRRGRCTTRRCYDRARVLDQPGVLATWDTGYQRTALLTPVKRKRGQRPTRRQQRGNARISRWRIAVEHAIGNMKIWRVASEWYRNPVRRHTLIVKNVAGLHNFMFS